MRFRHAYSLLRPKKVDNFGPMLEQGTHVLLRCAVMKTPIGISLSLAFAGTLAAQIVGLTTPPSGNNQRAEVTQFIGPVKVGIEYSSPAVHTADGTDRRGAIWGKLVPYEMTDLGFSGRLSPWRGGANENTVFSSSNDVLVEGKRARCGTLRASMMLAGPETWTLIFSKNAPRLGEASNTTRPPMRYASPLSRTSTNTASG